MNNFVSKIIDVPLGNAFIFSVGQAGYIIKSSSGQLLGIDLYLSDCVERLEGHKGFKRLLPKLFDPMDLQFDVLVSTHAHYDHLDIDSIPQMLNNSKTKLFASINCKQELSSYEQFDNKVFYVSRGEEYKCGDYKLCFVNCDHGIAAPDAVGVIIEVDGKVILNVGDTCLRNDYLQEYTQKGVPNVLIAPINGAYGNLNEKECIELSRQVNPGLLIPSHYGMFASHGGNLRIFYDEISNTNQKFNIMALGEVYKI